jgi:HPt (histidine-containing phosphotransfer) domain-containing protein
MNEDIIDDATFRELQETAGAEFVGELVDTFIEEAPQMLAELRAALAAGQAEAFRRAAHSLKSNSLTFGALALGAMARELELQGIGADAAATQQRVDALDAQLQRATAVLQERCRGE